MMHTKFSIAIPVYNVAPYLRECMDSLLNQTYENWEAICVDDGSTDGSGLILDEYAGKDRRFRVIHKKNQGVSAARNDALDVVTGDYVSFLDSDDYIHRDWIKKAADIVAIKNCDVARMQVSNDPKLKVQFNCKSADYIGDAALRFAWHEFCDQGYTCICFIKREIIGSKRFSTDLKFAEDSIWLISLVPNIETICQIAFAGYFHRPVSGSASRTCITVNNGLAYFNNVLSVWNAEKGVFPKRETIQSFQWIVQRMCDSQVITLAIRNPECAMVMPRALRNAYGKISRAVGFKALNYSGYERYRLGVLLFALTGNTWLIRLMSAVCHCAKISVEKFR